MLTKCLLTVHWQRRWHRAAFEVSCGCPPDASLPQLSPCRVGLQLSNNIATSLPPVTDLCQPQLYTAVPSSDRKPGAHPMDLMCRQFAMPRAGLRFDHASKAVHACAECKPQRSQRPRALKAHLLSCWYSRPVTGAGSLDLKFSTIGKSRGNRRTGRERVMGGTRLARDVEACQKKLKATSASVAQSVDLKIRGSSVQFCLTLASGSQARIGIVFMAPDSYPNSPALACCDNDEAISAELTLINEYYEEVAPLPQLLSHIFRKLDAGGPAVCLQHAWRYESCLVNTRMPLVGSTHLKDCAAPCKAREAGCCLLEACGDGGLQTPS